MIVFQPVGPMWLEVAVVLVTLVVFGFSVHASRHHTWKLRLVVGGLRLILLTFGLLLLHNPTWTRRTVIPKERRLAVLVDRSGSMGAAGDGSVSRYDKAGEVVARLAAADQQMDVFAFDQTLGEPGDGKTGAAKLSGNKTDFYAVLSQLFSERDDYEAVLLLSDGHDLGRFSTMSADETRQWLTRLNAPPINTVLIGDQLEGPEIAIHSIEAPSFSFVRAPMRIRTTVLVRNLDNHGTQVQLLEGEQVIRVQDLQLDAQGFGTVEFEIYPESQGEHLYTLQVPPHHLEKNVENNTQQVLVEVGRDKISVLHISGAITWDLQGLRAMFERNPMVDLTAFYIMRTRDHIQQGVDNRQIPHDEMALVPFPTEEIFDRQLFSFDVVVFHDFDAGTYFNDSYQARRLYKKIREFVTDHRGGFVVVGGPRTAGGPSLGLTPLADVLPLVPPIHRLAYAEGALRPKATTGGVNHPILRSFDPSMQVYDGHMDQLTENKQAEVLLRGGNNVPLLATASVGTGRTVFLNTSSSWKWRRDALASGGTGDTYYDFWEQTLKWVIGDPALDQVRITATKTVTNPLAADVDVHLRNSKYEPGANVTGNLVLRPLDGKTPPWDVPFTTNGEGLARVQFTVPGPGYYRLEPREEPWKSLSRPQTLFLGGSQDELRNLDLVPETLQRLASFSGGRFTASTREHEPGAITWGDARRQTVVQTQRLKLRNWIWCLPLLLLIVAVEWTIRRSGRLA